VQHRWRLRWGFHRGESLQERNLPRVDSLVSLVPMFSLMWDGFQREKSSMCCAWGGKVLN